jgi:MoaA/NifB/PqqE/SkfB family radical SAM enzyme
MERTLCEDAIGQLRDCGVREVVLTGCGEPTLHPHFGEIAAACGGLNGGIISNGTLLDEEKVRALVDNRFKRVRVSLWANDRDEYAANYPGTPGHCFDRVLGGIQRLVAYRDKNGLDRPHVGIHRPINRHNCEGLAGVPDLLDACGADFFSTSPLKTNAPGGWAGDQVADRDRLFASLRRLAEELEARGKRHNIPVTLERYRVGERVWEELPCYAGWFHARITEEGEVGPCNRQGLMMGNLRKQRFADIWQSPRWRAFRRQAITRRGIGQIAATGGCEFCCHYAQNRKIHKRFARFSRIRYGAQAPP